MILGGIGENLEFTLPTAWKGKRRRAQSASKDLCRGENAEPVYKPHEMTEGSRQKI